MADIDNKPTVGTAPAAQPTTVPQEVQNPGPRSASEVARQPQPRPCPQDCSKCSTPQHIFCSTKMLFDLSRAFQESRRQQAEIVQAVADIQQQLKKEQEVQLSLPFDAEA
jgi:hypothetical protein